MRFGNRHLAGASLFLVASMSLIAPPVNAQECQDCQTCQDGQVCHDGAACYADGDSDGVCAGGCGLGHQAYGKACYGYRPYTEASQPDVFYNLYVPNNFGAAGAAYPAPYPTPNLIGHTYYTYQPLMPHEFLYQHHRTYHQYYNRGMGLNRTSVSWHGTPIRTGLKGVKKFFSLPR